MIADDAMIGFAPCFSCRRLFAFDVERVPSYGGQPICHGCITIANDRRRAAGLSLWPILPGAYPFDDETPQRERQR